MYLALFRALRYFYLAKHVFVIVVKKNTTGGLANALEMEVVIEVKIRGNRTD